MNRPFPSTNTPTLDAEPIAVERTSMADGAVIAGRYRVVRRLGAGGMGTVYEAEHLGIGRRVAVKILSLEWLHSPDALRRFRAEARAAGSIGHPNIVEVFDADELPDGRPFLVMELLRGRDLLDIVERDGPLPWRRACELGARVAHALAAAHARGIIHRDLKAENVMIVEHPDGLILKVLDFGIAADLSAGGSRETRPGLAIGTPAYMAPEQARGETPSPSFDVYALGALLYEMLSGAPPFLTSNPLETIGLKLVTPAPSIATRVPDLPAALVALVDACVQIDPAARPSSAAEIAERLEGLLSPTMVLDAAAAAVVPARRRIGVVAATAVVALGVAAAVAWPRPQPDEITTVVEPTPIAEPTPIVEDVPLAELPTPPTTSAPLEAEAIAIEPVAPEPTSEAAPRKPSPRPRPAVVTPTPEVTPPKPAVVDPPEDTRAQACVRARREAEDARAAHDWRGVLRHSEDARCWPSAGDRTKLRVKANMELARFSECVRLGEDNQDVEVVKWVKLCRKRLDGVQ